MQDHSTSCSYINPTAQDWHKVHGLWWSHFHDVCNPSFAPSKEESQKAMQKDGKSTFKALELRPLLRFWSICCRGLKSVPLKNAFKIPQFTKCADESDTKWFWFISDSFFCAGEMTVEPYFIVCLKPAVHTRRCLFDTEILLFVVTVKTFLSSLPEYPQRNCEMKCCN